MDVAFDLELHLPFQDDHHFIGGVREVFPTLPGRIGPQVATETAGGPVCGDLLAVDQPDLSAWMFANQSGTVQTLGEYVEEVPGVAPSHR